MFDTMTITKAGGAVCGSLLALLLVKWGADSVYDTRPAHKHGEEVAQAYSVDTGAEDAPAAGAAAGGDEKPFADVFAAADIGAGEKIFGKCKSCHKVDGTNATGPHLNDVVGRAVGSVADFPYSDAMKAHGGTWDPETMNQFLTSPKTYVPGTKMGFAGLPNVEDRANVIAYLKSLEG